MPDQSLGRAIRARRQALGLTQEALAERVGEGVRQSDVSRLERDKIALPHPARVRALARALELAPGELLVCAGWLGAEQPNHPPDRPAREGGRGSAVPPLEPGSGAGPTRLGQALRDAQATKQATARSLQRADEVWTWATDPQACRQPFATFARDRHSARARPPVRWRDGVPAEGEAVPGGLGPDDRRPECRAVGVRLNED